MREDGRSVVVSVHTSVAEPVTEPMAPLGSSFGASKSTGGAGMLIALATMLPVSTTRRVAIAEGLGGVHTSSCWVRVRLA
jgi:hypothetical protein